MVRRKIYHTRKNPLTNSFSTQARFASLSPSSFMIRASCKLLQQPFRVRVSGLPYNTAPSEVVSMFREYDATHGIKVTSETGKDLGQVLVSFPSVESAIQATQDMNGSFFVPQANTQPRRVSVTCDFRGPRIVEEVMLPREPNPRKLIKRIRDKAVGAKYPVDPVMASTNESRMLRRYKTGGLPRSHDRQR